jgi:hypothetical protein
LLQLARFLLWILPLGALGLDAHNGAALDGSAMEGRSSAPCVCGWHGIAPIGGVAFKLQQQLGYEISAAVKLGADPAAMPSYRLQPVRNCGRIPENLTRPE